MNFRIIDDTIELDGLPVAAILSSVWPTRRDDLVVALEAYDPDELSKLAEAQYEIEDLNATIAGLREEIEDLQAEIAELEDAQ